MTDAPERIWAARLNDEHCKIAWGDWDDNPDDPNPGTEYIREDIPDARIAELEEALSAIIALHQTASSAAWEAAQMTAIARACAALKGKSDE